MYISNYQKNAFEQKIQNINKEEKVKIQNLFYHAMFEKIMNNFTGKKILT